VSTRLLFRRTPHLVSYWHDDQLTFANYATDVYVTVDPFACEILHFFGRWRSLSALAAHFREYTAASLGTAVDTLVRHSLLIRSDRVPDRTARAMDAWASWNPAAGFFHIATKDVEFTRDQEVIARRLRRKFKESPPPPPVKRYRGVRALRLPPPRTDGVFPRVLLERRTWREFSRRPMTLADLGTLLGLTWRIQDWVPVRGRGRLPLKTSPSGGALHPIEVYVLARRVDGVRPGLYHYAADRHRLELVRAGASRRQIVKYLPTQTWFGTAAAVMLMTAVFPRTQWKYEFPRAYRVVLAEAGHLCQSFCLTATWLGLAPFCTMALADSAIERDLRIDGLTESVLYAAGVGLRPTLPGAAP
jgi:SagB-type dehydrogenase family enzyme